MYNKYISSTGQFRRGPEVCKDPRQNGNYNRHNQSCRDTHTHSAPPVSHNSSFSQGSKKPSLFGGDGLKNIKKSIDKSLPFGMDSGDLILLLLLFLLYLDSGDEEFLIILAVLAYGFFKDRDEH